jgi:NAD(P)H dehydrogenase (quinone)
MRVAVTGAGGKTGAALLGALDHARHAARALVHRERPADLDEDVDHVVGDVRDAATLDRLLAGADAVVHVPPNLHDDELTMAEAVVAACHRAGVDRLVYHSVLHPQTSAMPHHWQKLRVEELLLTAGLDVAVVQPAPYAQNLLPYLAADDPVFPYPPDTAFALVDLRDVAEATARVLADPAAAGGTFPLCSGERLTQGEAWALVSGGRPYRHVDPATWLDRQGLSGRQRDWLAAMFTYYAAHGLPGSPVVLRTLLGRAPRRLADLRSAR